MVGYYSPHGEMPEFGYVHLATVKINEGTFSP